jgi:hypothetical protein
MLRFFNAAARLLRPLRPLFWLFLAASIIGFGMVILDAFGMSDGYAIAFLVLSLWSLSLLLVVMCFPRHTVEVLSGDGFLPRLRKRIDGAFTWLVVVLTVVLNIVVIVTTVRLAGIFING